MVYSSSLMEANFFTIAQRREFAVRAIEEANRLATIQQLSTVRGGVYQQCKLKHMAGCAGTGCGLSRRPTAWTPYSSSARCVSGVVY